MASAPSDPMFDSARFDWDSYLKYRPDYNCSGFYQNIWDYHNSKGGGWECAHDVGAGPGQVSEVLAKHFGSIALSDAVPFQVEVARARLKPLGDQVKFKVCSAEQLAQYYPESSADMIVVPECIPLMDQQLAMKAFEKILRPGGTLAIWFYATPIFEDPAIQTLYRELSGKSYDVFRPMKGGMWERASRTCADWLDNVDLRGDAWGQVERIKWNYDQPMSWEDPSNFDFDYQKASSVGPDEKIKEIIDRKFWTKQVDAEWCFTGLDRHLPRKTEWKTDEVKAMYRELERLMGGPGKQHDISYPAVLILATKK